MKFLSMIIKNKKQDELAGKKRLGRIIAITNQKGGVGKSTTAVNVSAYLSSYGYKTLLIDLDPQSNSTSGLGVNPMDVKQSIYDILIHDREPDEIIIDTSYKDLRLLPSSIQLAGAEVELVSSLKREFR